VLFICENWLSTEPVSPQTKDLGSVELRELFEPKLVILPEQDQFGKKQFSAVHRSKLFSLSVRRFSWQIGKTAFQPSLSELIQLSILKALEFKNPTEITFQFISFISFCFKNCDSQAQITCLYIPRVKS